jgi:hypothetical protein
MFQSVTQGCMRLEEKEIVIENRERETKRKVYNVRINMEEESTKRRYSKFMQRRTNTRVYRSNFSLKLWGYFPDRIFKLYKKQCAYLVHQNQH